MSDIFIIAPKLDDDKLPEAVDSHDERFFVSEFEARKALEDSFQPWMRDKYEIYQATLSVTNVFGKEAPFIDIEGIMSPKEDEAADSSEEQKKSWEEDFRDRFASNPSTNPADYYFQMDPDPDDPSNYYFTINPKEYFDKTGALFDDGSEAIEVVLPPGFNELQEGMYEFSGNYGRGRLTLLSNGFIEKKMF